jgi:hypothetical protein
VAEIMAAWREPFVDIGVATMVIAQLAELIDRPF